MAMSRQEPTADLAVALRHAAGLLDRDPRLAGAQAREILAVYPKSDSARQILAAAHRLQGDVAAALEVITPVAELHQDSVDVRHEYALCLAASDRSDEAIAVLQQVVEAEPAHAAAWRTLGDQLAAAGDDAGSEVAYEKHLQLSTKHPELLAAAAHLRDGQLGKAEHITREVLKADPLDTSAMRMLAAIGMQVGQVDDAIHLLERCLELEPGFHFARQNYASALSRRQRIDEALAQMDRLLTVEPGNPQYRMMRCSMLVQKGDHDEALKEFEPLVREYPKQANAWMNYAHTLKAVGRLDESIEAYRRAIGLRPVTGEVYWSLANLKTFRFDDADVERMRDQVELAAGNDDDQAHLLFALGKALEDRAEYEASFRCYERGNQVRAKRHRHNAKINVFDTARQIKTLTADFFAERQEWGSSAPDPIFVVGLPRSGSTLLEQILSSHSLVEGTAELHDIIAISRKLGKRSRKHPAGDYPEILATLSREQAAELGDGYIRTTSVQRHGPPFFIDKLPNNFRHIGLIHLVLPNAKIIDARRHPMACCFSNFKQLFAHGQTFTYDLTNLGYYYRDYVRLMDHWDEVLPGRVHRVQYENMVADTENEIRRLLEYCGLQFEEGCLRFYETERAIRTPSSEQVRRPVYREGLEQWRHFEPWLGPLKDALGPVLERYPID